MTPTSPSTTNQLPNASHQPAIYALTDFYDKATALRSEFEEKLASSDTTNAGLTPFSYVFSRNRCQLLTASAEQVFSRAILDDLIDRICSWAADTLGTLHVSTPQVRVYINGCKRDLVRDNINARWHYLLSLSLDWPRSSSFNVMTGPQQHDNHVDMIGLLKSRLVFNQLVVHDVRDAYGVDFSGSVMNPAHAVVFLDGYLW